MSCSPDSGARARRPAAPASPSTPRCPDWQKIRTNRRRPLGGARGGRDFHPSSDGQQSRGRERRRDPSEPPSWRRHDIRDIRGSLLRRPGAVLEHRGELALVVGEADELLTPDSGLELAVPSTVTFRGVAHRLTWTSSSGVRAWWACEWCGRRCQILAELPGVGWACPKCCRTAHDHHGVRRGSTPEAVARGLLYVLGAAEVTLFGRLPERPPWMGEMRYLALLGDYVQARRKALGSPHVDPDRWAARVLTKGGLL